jgi:flagellar basal body-associated protein FliL
MMPKKEGGTSGVIAIIVIVVLLALGGIYYLMTSGNAMLPVDEVMPTLTDVQNSTDPDVQATMQQGSSDALADIEADLGATDLTGLDTEIGNLGQ